MDIRLIHAWWYNFDQNFNIFQPFNVQVVHGEEFMLKLGIEYLDGYVFI